MLGSTGKNISVLTAESETKAFSSCLVARSYSCCILVGSWERECSGEWLRRKAMLVGTEKNILRVKRIVRNQSVQ